MHVGVVSITAGLDIEINLRPSMCVKATTVRGVRVRKCLSAFRSIHTFRCMGDVNERRCTRARFTHPKAPRR